MAPRSIWIVLLSLISGFVFASRESNSEWKPAFADTVFIYRPTPEYPFELRRARMTGYGYFRLHINKQGQVTAITVLQSTGHHQLDAEAMKALIRWRAKSGPLREFDIPMCFAITGSRLVTPTPAPLPPSRMRVIND